MTKKYATLWGKEQDGTLTVPVINLWKSRKGAYAADNLGGALQSGTRVEVIERQGNWVKVYKLVKHEGEDYPQEGWVKKSLVKF
jgi:hypothetical protein